jgi:septal ring factor EnvC (AmiA/AmiB activator)
VEFIEFANRIVREWSLLVLFFTLGTIWWQIKTWFEKVNKKMEEFVSAEWYESVELRMVETSKVHDQQNDMLIDLHTKISRIEEKVERIDTTLSKVHDEVHEQEIKIAVLESQPRRAAR